MSDESASEGAPPARLPGPVVLALTLLAAATLAFVALRLLSDPTRTNGDAASLLMQVVVFAEGRAPVSVLAGMNPPLILYFCALPVLLARLVGAPLLALHTAFLALVVALSAWNLREALRAGARFPPATRALVFLAFAVAQLLATGESFSFGQRDHLFATVALPYLVFRVARLEGAPLPPGRAVFVGLLAAFGVLLKPTFVVAIGLAELTLALLHRRWPTARHPEVGAAFAAAAAYVVHFAFLPRSYLDALRGALRGTVQGYGAFDLPLRDLLANPAVAPVFLAALAAFLALGRGATPSRRLAGVVAGYTLGGLAGFLLQHKGFGHHVYPALSGAAVLAGALATEAALLFRDRIGERGGRLVRVAGLAGAVVAGALLLRALAGSASRAVQIARKGVTVPVRSALHAALLSRSAPGDEVVFFSTTIPLAFPVLLETDRRPLGRYTGPLMEVAFFQPAERGPGTGPVYRPLERMEPGERALLEEVGREIEARRPRLLLIATSRNFGCPPGFSFVPYLEAAGFFDGPLRPYRRVSDVEDRWGDVEVWARADER